MSHNVYPFLEGGGEMGAHTRAYDWSKTSLGMPDGWPQSLRTTLSIVLNSRFPMFLFWGPEHICFYNDAYRPSLGDDEKSLTTLGNSGADAWPEIWSIIGPQIEQVMGGGEATWHEDKEGAYYRNGQMESIFFTYSYSPVRDEGGEVAGVFVTCMETTATLKHSKDILQSEHRFRSLIEEAPVATMLMTGPSHVIEIANEKMLAMLGKGTSIIGKPATNAVPELSAQPYLQLLDSVYQSGEPQQHTRMPGELIIDGEPRLHYFDFTYKPVRNTQGEIYGVISVAVDVTAQVQAIMQLEENTNELRAMIESAPFPIGVYTGRELRIRLANKNIKEVFGKGDDVEGKLYTEILPELESQKIFEQMRETYDTGVAFHSSTQRVNIEHDGKLKPYYFNYSFTPLFDTFGKVYGIMNTASDVTELEAARYELEQSELKLRAIVDNAHAAIGLYVGEDMVIENPNQIFIDILGKGPDIAGKPLREVMPELLTEGQPVLNILKDVYITGVPFTTAGSMIKIFRGGEMTNGYYNFSYTPISDATGKTYAIVVVAIDVTEQVEARNELQKKEAALRGAVELAELGNFNVDVATNTITVSQRVADWFGFDQLVADADSFINGVGESERDYVRGSLGKAMTPGGDGRYDVVHSVVHSKTGRKIILHALGLTHFDEDGSPTRVEGTAQDVTIQRELQTALEGEVQQRTEELASVVEELRSTNEELSESNQQLLHSNDELAQYAYVASHDLQEPLRKIQVFSGILNKAPELAENSRTTLAKIAGAAERMSLLIQDLLSFSRLLKSETLMRPVSMGEIVLAVWDDFELLVEEKHARIEVGMLPTIQAVNLQINQLFNNLISNALKFTSPDVAPVITVESRPMSDEDVRRYIPKPLSFSGYHHITVRDNGIGFETQYNEQIFEVFKRLHGRDTYPGSGIGLALCRRIVANHNGYLHAVSEVGAGSTFHIILPERQHDAASAYADEPPMTFTHMN